MLIFESAKLDAWVLEIGMGGRFDAVNIVDPAVSVVVSIGLDHQEFLGPTLEAIAREKAGIFRRGVPAVLGSCDMPAVLETRCASGRRAAQAPGRRIHFARDAKYWRYRGTRWDLPDLPAAGAFGRHSIRNAAAAIAALEELAPRLILPAAAVAQGLTSVRLIGRFQVVPPTSAGRPTWILDVAHNPDAAGVLARNLRCAARPPAGRSRCAAYSPTKMRRESPRSCAAASTGGGWPRPKERAASAAPRSRLESRRRLRRPSHL